MFCGLIATPHTRHEEQKRAKERYDKKSVVKEHKIGDWVLVRFPKEETGKKRKLSKPWHGPYRVIQKNDPDVTVIPVHFPESGAIQVHQSRVCSCPPKWPTGFYWYGGQKLSRGGAPKWLEKLLSRGPTQLEDEIVLLECPEDRSPPEEVIFTELDGDSSPQEDGSVPTELAQDSNPESVCDDDGGGKNLATSAPDRKLLPSGRYNLRQNVKPPKRFEEQGTVRDEHTS